MTVFTLDGVAYPDARVTKLKRSFSVLDGPNAGRVMTGEMVRDIIGTYYNYAIEIEVAESAIQAYDALYEVITAPATSHTLTVPYGQTVFTFEAYVTNGDDELMSMEGGRNKWGHLAFNFIAMVPRRRPA